MGYRAAKNVLSQIKGMLQLDPAMAEALYTRTVEVEIVQESAPQPQSQEPDSISDVVPPTADEAGPSTDEAGPSMEHEPKGGKKGSKHGGGKKRKGKKSRRKP